MTSLRCTGVFFIVFVIGVVLSSENYMDYRNEAPGGSVNVRDLFRYIVQRSADEGAAFRELEGEHLQPRAAERSPSLRLRFGRSGVQRYPMASRLNGASSVYEEK